MKQTAPVDWYIGLDDPPRARTEIQAVHKGSGSRGISAPGKGTGLNNILLWWRPEIGETFGYADGWTEDGTAFYYSGTGQEGDQVFAAPHIENKRVRDHIATGDHVRLLRDVGNNSVVYLGELRLEQDDPYHYIDAPDRLGKQRRVIQFRLLPVGAVRQLPGDPVRQVPAPVAQPAEAPVASLPRSPRPTLKPSSRPSSSDWTPPGSWSSDGSRASWCTTSATGWPRLTGSAPPPSTSRTPRRPAAYAPTSGFLPVEYS